MRKLFFFLLLALAPAAIHAQTYGHFQDFCTSGGTRALTQGTNSTNYMLSTFPSCTVTVYLAGTTSPVTLFSNASGASLSNPFTATTSGYFSFYSLLSVGNVDVKMSGTGMTTTTLSNIDLVGSGGGGGGGVTSINGTAGNFTFTGAGVTCATTTCTFSGGGSGNFNAATYNALLGLTNSAGGTNAALWAVAGTKLVVAGVGGATDSECPPWVLGGIGQSYSLGLFINYSQCILASNFSGDTGERRVYKTSPLGQNPAGGGSFRGVTNTFNDDAVADTAFGSWHFGAMFTNTYFTSSPGIGQMENGSFWNTTLGDKALKYYYFNTTGGTSTGADEGVIVERVHIQPLGSYFGTVNASAPANSSVIHTTQVAGCGGNGISGLCSGGGRVLLKTSSAQPITVATQVIPNLGANTLGVMTFAETLTPSSGLAIIANAAPHTSTFATGDTFTSPFTISSGTLPSSGIGCWISTSANYEAASYSTSGSTITITTHRYQHTANSWFYAGDCLYFDPTPDSHTFGNYKTAFVAVVTDPHTLVYTTYAFGSINNGSFLGLATFRAGVAGRNGANLYAGARVLDLADPTAPVGGAASATGYMHLEPSSVAWIAGESVEQALYPSQSTKGYVLDCTALMPNTTGCYSTTLTGPVGTAYDINVNNLINDTNGVNGFDPPIAQLFSVRASSPTNSGIYTTLFNITRLPTGDLFDVSDTNAPGAGARTGLFVFPGTAGSYFRRDISQYQFWAASTYNNGKLIVDGNPAFQTNPTQQAALNFQQTQSGNEPASPVAGDMWWNGRLKFRTSTPTTEIIPYRSEVMRYVGTINTSSAPTNDLTVTGLVAGGHCSFAQVDNTEAPLVGPMYIAFSGFFRLFDSSATAGQQVDVFCIVP